MAKAKSKTGIPILDWLYDNDIEVVTEPEPTTFVQSGSLYVDWVFGGGIPKGRFTVLHSPESWGKSTLALLVAKSVIQNNGGRVLYMDVEAALDPLWAARFGLDLNQAADAKNAERRMFLAQPSSAEKCLNAISKAIDLKDPADATKTKPAFDLIIVDSLSALATEAELAGQIGDSVVAGVARVLSQFYRMAKGRLAESGVAVLQIAQERAKFGQSWGHGPQVDIPGGKAVKYYASVIAKLVQKPVPVIDKSTGELVGLQMKIRTSKNKVSRVGREAEFTVYIDQGEADIFDELAALGKEFGVFSREDGSPISGGGYWWMATDNGMRKIAIGQAAVAAALDADRELAAEVEGIIRLKIANMNRGEPVGMVLAGENDTPAVPPDDADEYLADGIEA